MKSGRNSFKKYKKLINLVVKFYSFFTKKSLTKKLERFRYTKGNLGYLLRYCILKNLAKNCGDNVSIDVGVYLLHPENLHLGENVSINPMCYIDASGGIIIGNNVSIAHGATIMSSTHTYSDASIPIKYNPIFYKKTKISDNVWIGAKVTILYGIEVSEGCVIGANSVVTKNTLENSIYVGSPARKIKGRF